MSRQTQAWPSAATGHGGMTGAYSWSDSQAASPSRCTCSTATAAYPGPLTIAAESRPAAAGLVLACMAARRHHLRCLHVA